MVGKEMGEIIKEIIDYGAFGITTIIGFFLYFKERKYNKENSDRFLNQQIKDTKYKSDLASSVTNAAKSIESLENQNNVLNNKLDEVIKLSREERIRDEERIRNLQ
jgi:hypothetical protein